MIFSRVFEVRFSRKFKWQQGKWRKLAKVSKLPWEYTVNSLASLSYATSKDINECQTQTASSTTSEASCVEGFECRNLPGTYTCQKVYKKIECPDGYQQVNDICRGKH